MTFSADQRRIGELRLIAQRIATPPAASPAETVRWMLALQAQDFAGVKWSVGVRQHDGTQAAVEAACDAGEIVRSWPMRGTLHLVAAEDLQWMLELTTPRFVASAGARRAYLGISDLDVERARDIAVAALNGGRAMAREALLGSIHAGGVSTEGQRGYHLLWYLAQTGTLVLGAADGRQQTFALLDEWVPHPRRLERDEALGELARRFFASHGPATAKDLARWSGLTMAQVRVGITVAGDVLTTLELDGTRYHLAPETLDAAAPGAGVYLLPGFDEYVLGYQDRAAVLAPEHSQAIVPGGNGVFRPTIVVDGAVAGTWRRTARAREVVVEAAPFAPLTRPIQAGLRDAVEAYGAFLGQPARLIAP
ncbi:MAG: winged helix DNA-binding domain-containing protein [Candidatus Limnocylindrales bacterium]